LRKTEKLLVAKPWKLLYTKDYVVINDKIEYLYTISSDSCERLNWLTLNSDKKGFFVFTCAGDSARGTWNVAGDELNILIHYLADYGNHQMDPEIYLIQNAHLEKITSDSLVLSQIQGHGILTYNSDLPDDIYQRKFYLVH
jgi:hypothetical protein